MRQVTGVLRVSGSKSPDGCNGIVHALRPGTESWSHFVATRLSEVAQLLAVAYKSDDRGQSFHEARIVQARPWLYFIEDNRGKIVAASYLFRGGRRAASGVAPDHERHGHYTAMVDRSLNDVGNQFTEMRPTQDVQRRVLDRLGFEVQNQWSEVEKLLGPILIPTVVRVWSEGSELRYERSSFDGGELREFLLMQRGSPPPIVQTTPYYTKGLIPRPAQGST